MSPRKIVIGLLAMLLAAASWAGTAGLAHAGGPTSVLIVSPSAHRATGLYRTEPGYQDLIKAIGGDGQPSGSISEPARVDLGDDKEVRLTWMVHDVSVWRIDRIYITRSDGIWINTMTDQEGGNPLDQPGSWHRPQNDAALLAVLKSSGILTSSVAPGVDSSSQASPGAVRRSGWWFQPTIDSRRDHCRRGCAGWACAGRSRFDAPSRAGRRSRAVHAPRLAARAVPTRGRHGTKEARLAMITKLIAEPARK
jgi:hypothetical protein